ncbi:FAD-dependent oxidoreductase, partial [Serratia marcescens]
CMPSKLLIAAAEAVHQIERAPGFGVHPTGKTRIDGREVMARVKRERDRFVGFVLEGVDEIPASDKIQGYARFIDDNTLQVDEHTRIVAQRIVIATGSRPSWPAPWNELGDRLIVNDDLFNWDDLPQSVAVFGPGVIGLELGQALHRLGVDTKVFGIGGAVGPLTDSAVRDYAAKALGDEFYLDADVKVEMMQREGDKVFIRYQDLQGQPQEILVD